MNLSHCPEVVLKKYEGIKALQGPGSAGSVQISGQSSRGTQRLFFSSITCGKEGERKNGRSCDCLIRDIMIVIDSYLCMDF